VISNDECYEKASKINNPIVKQSAKRAMPEGVTDQILCTLGILVELENGRTVVSGPCQGDSGGPLYIRDGQKRTLIAIQSGGAGCGNIRYKDAPKWWMRVSKFADWVKCYSKNARKSHISHRDVERKCRKLLKQSNFPSRCDHSELFLDPVDSCE